MREDLLHILSESNKDIDNQRLMDYLAGKLTEEQKHEIEQQLADDPFYSEALEGLEQAGDEKKLQTTVDHLNRQLQKFLQQKKKKKQRAFQFYKNTWIYIAVLFILTLAAIVFLILADRL